MTMDPQFLHDSETLDVIDKSMNLNVYEIQDENELINLFPTLLKNFKYNCGVLNFNSPYFEPNVNGEIYDAYNSFENDHNLFRISQDPWPPPIDYFFI